MSNPLRRGSIIAALCVAAAVVTGCSVIRLGYGQADALVFRWLDAYVDFDGAQSSRTHEALDRWFAWHRRTQLPDYADLLTRVDAEVLADTTPERVCGWWGEARERIDRGAERALPAIADVVVTLKPEQLQGIEKRYAKTNAEFRDDVVTAEPAKRMRETVKRVAGRAEWVYGDLDSGQRELLTRWVGDSPSDPVAALDERRHRQQESLQMLRRVTGGTVAPAEAEAEVRTWLQHLERSPREAYRVRADRIVQHNCRMFAALHNSTSASQRQTASKRLRGWAAELRAMAADSGA
ncbi:MAG: DUF6279 family lipoprotein [Caldimonas sp.]